GGGKRGRGGPGGGARERGRRAEKKAPARGSAALPKDAIEPDESPEVEMDAPQPTRLSAAVAAEFAPSFTFAVGGVPEHGIVAMPTAEAVARVVSQYRGGLAKVAEVLGRNRRTVMELLERLNLMEHVVTVRNNERKRILAAPLRERLTDLLFREKLLDDLGCLKEVDESARTEIQLRCVQLAKTCSTQEEAF